MSTAVGGLLRGTELGLAVSLLPGASWVVCVALARDGLAAVASLILAVALTDCLYATLCVAVQVVAADAQLLAALHWGSAALLFVGAVALWPRERRRLDARAGSVLAALNPATASLWLGLSGSRIGAPAGAGLALVPVGTLLATAAWFTILALIARRASRLLGSGGRWPAVGTSVALAALAAVQVAIMLGW